MDIRLFGIETLSLVNGEGMRFVIFTQGCIHNCPNCQNPDSHDLNSGYFYDTKELCRDILNHPFIDGITLSGGDPFMQQDACALIADFCHKHHLTVWCYTGYTYKQLVRMDAELLRHIDVLVDGKFVESLKSDQCKYRGSTNQRVIALHNGKYVKDLYEVN